MNDATQAGGDQAEAGSRITPIRPGVAEIGGANGHRRSRSRAPTGFFLVALTAVGAAMAAGVTHGSPTGVSSVDLTLKILLALLCVAAARWTPWPFVGLAGITAAVASYGSVDAIIAMATTAICLGAWRYSSAPDVHHGTDSEAGDVSRAVSGDVSRGVSGDLSDDRSDDAAEEAGEEASDDAVAETDDRLDPAWAIVARSAAAGILACLALRSTWPHVSLGPSVMAAAVVLLLVIPGLISAPKRARRVIVRVAALVILAVLILAGIAAAAVLEAKQPLQAGLSAAHQGLAAAEHGEQATAVAQFKQAASDFNAARSDLEWARASEMLPIVSQQVRAVRVAASIGSSLATAGVATAASTSEHDLKPVDGVFPVAKLHGLVPLFKQDLAVLDSVLSQTRPFASPWLLGALKSRFATEEARLHRAQHDAHIGLMAAQVLPGFLGADGPRTYLLLVENPAESRASGGVVGDFAEVSADAGRLRLVHVGSTEYLNRAGVPPLHRKLPDIKDFIDRYDAFFPQDHWENIPMSPDFPTVGRVASFLFPQSGGVPVNGVISIDPVAMAGLLKIVGPVAWPGHGHIDAGNAVSFLAHQEFVDFSKDNAARIKFVEGLLKTVWHELVTRSLPQPSAMAKDMSQALKGGHLRLYSPDAATESFFTQVHLAGAFPKVNGDFLGVVTQNAEGNKIDWYLRRHISYDAHVDLATDSISATATVTLDNLAPSSGQPPYVINGLHGTGTTPGQSLLWLSIYTPWPMISVTVNGKVVSAASQVELGRSVYSLLVKIQPGGSSTVVVRLGGPWTGGQQYRLGMYRQPVMTPDFVSTSVTVTK